jgi:ABC-type lipopolysaccharide export system ATPase subunit
MDQTGQGLVATGLAKSFGKRQVVHDVSLSLQRGEVVGLLGPNGAGKTTCFYMIMGLIGADDGAIRIDGADVTALPMYQRARLGLGYLPQEASIFRGMSVEENIMAVVELVERDKSERQNQVDSLLEELHIAHFALRLVRIVTRLRRESIRDRRLVLLSLSGVRRDHFSELRAPDVAIGVCIHFFQAGFELF